MATRWLCACRQPFGAIFLRRTSRPSSTRLKDRGLSIDRALSPQRIDSKCRRTAQPANTMPNSAPISEETLDPSDWESMRELGHRMVDDMLDYLRTVRDRPVWQPIPPETKQFLRQPLPIATSTRISWRHCKKAAWQCCRARLFTAALLCELRSRITGRAATTLMCYSERSRISVSEASRSLWSNAYARACRRKCRRDRLPTDG